MNQPIHGGFLHILIQAKDKEGNPRASGGDFWLATLMSNSNTKQGESVQTEAGTAGKIIDHKNGTYSVYFYLGWVGRAEVHIDLVHSSDVIAFLRNKYWMTEGKAIWNGFFKNNSEHGAKEAVSECTIRRGGPRKEDCEYWFPQAMGQTVFVCHKPHPNSTCSSLDRIKYNFDTSMRVTRDMVGKFGMLEG